MAEAPWYREWAAHPALAGDVACLWCGHVAGNGEPSTKSVLPDGCIDIVWDGSCLQIAGPDTGPVPIAPAPGTFFAGLRFRPGRAPRILGLPACDLLDRRVPLRDVWGARAAEDLGDALSAGCSAGDAASLLQAAVLDRSVEARRPDALVDAVVETLTDRGGAPTSRVVAGLSRPLLVSERQLHRRCVAAVGYGPKTLDRVMRFRSFHRLLLSGRSLARLAAESGYSDQAHLDRECRRLAGTTPSEFFKTAPVPAP